MKTIVENKKITGIDNQKTKVLLIGVSEYVDDKDIKNIPNIKQNIKLLKQVLIDKDIMGVPKENITVSFNDSKKDIERKLIIASREAENENETLLVYYSGHGILSSENFKLYLTSKESSKAYLESDSINIDRFREIIASSRAASKIVILDACHSGQIHNAMNNFESTISSEIKKFEGTYIMTSASEDSPSLFPHNNTKKATYFTAKMIDVLKKGIENNNQYLSVRDIYNEIYNCFNKQAGMPLPQQSIFQEADSILISKNRIYDTNIDKEKSHFSYSDRRSEIFNLKNNSELLLERKNFKFKNFITAGKIVAITIILFVISSIGFIYIKSNFNKIEQAPIIITTVSKLDTIVNNKEYINPVVEQAYILVKRANILYARGEYYYNDALIFYVQANNLLEDSDKNLKNRIRNLEDEIEVLYFAYIENAKTLYKADDSYNETLEVLNNALNLKPNDATALRKINELEIKY